MSNANAPMIYLTAGISGSGKSHFANHFCKSGNTVELNLDNFRREISGNCSDQSVSAQAVKKQAKEMAKYLAGGYNVMLSNTNLGVSVINSHARDYPFNDFILFIIKDSFDPQLCKDRVADDIASGVDRSNVPMDVIDKQHERFLQLIADLDKLEKNVEVRYVDQNGSISSSR